eukprot:gene11028-14809_t
MMEPHDYQRLIAVKKELWYGAGKGLITGSLCGLMGHLLTLKFKVSPSYSANKKNNIILAVCVCGAFGSFVGGTVYGKNAVAYIGDIFRKKLSNEVEDLPSHYMEQLHRNQEETLKSMDSSFLGREESIKKAKLRRESEKQKPDL